MNAVVETAHAGDGYALRRRWSSHGQCPTELLVTDPYGQISFRGPKHEDGRPRLTQQVCSWRLRPGLFLRDGYLSDMTGPITISFSAFSLTPYEAFEVWSADTDDISFKRENDILEAYQRRKREVFTESTAATAVSVAPGTAATEALLEVAEEASRAAATAAARAGIERIVVEDDTRRLSPPPPPGRRGKLDEEAAAEAAAAAAAAAAAVAEAAERRANEEMIAAYEAFGGQGGDIIEQFSIERAFDDTYARSRSGQRLALLARYEGGGYPGNDPPPKVTSTAAELLLVYRSRPPYLNSTRAWADISSALAKADVLVAVRAFLAAGAARLRGFYNQDIRRLLHATARRLIRTLPGEEAQRLSGQLFPGRKVAIEGTKRGGNGLAQTVGGGSPHEDEDGLESTGFGAIVDRAITQVAQEHRRWAARSNIDQTNPHGAYSERWTPRQYPTADYKGEPNVKPPQDHLLGLELHDAQSFFAGFVLGHSREVVSANGSAHNPGSGNDVMADDPRDDVHTSVGGGFGYTIYDAVLPDPDPMVAPIIPTFEFNFSTEVCVCVCACA